MTSYDYIIHYKLLGYKRNLRNEISKNRNYNSIKQKFYKWRLMIFWKIYPPCTYIYVHLVEFKVKRSNKTPLIKLDLLLNLCRLHRKMLHSNQIIGFNLEHVFTS